MLPGFPVYTTKHSPVISAGHSRVFLANYGYGDYTLRYLSRESVLDV